MFAAGVMVAVFPATWILERLQLLDVQGLAWNGYWTLFVWGFTFPFFLLMVSVTWINPPIILVQAGRMTLRHPTLYWKAVTISTADVQWADFDPGWAREEAPCQVRLLVSSECYERLSKQSRWICGNVNWLAHDVANCTENPDQIAANINRLISKRRGGPLG